MFRVNLTHLSQAGGEFSPPLATRLQGQGQQEGGKPNLTRTLKPLNH